jgi:hypothetical protein
MEFQEFLRKKSVISGISRMFWEFQEFLGISGISETITEFYEFIGISGVFRNF